MERVFCQIIIGEPIYTIKGIITTDSMCEIGLEKLEIRAFRMMTDGYFHTQNAAHNGRRKLRKFQTFSLLQMRKVTKIKITCNIQGAS